MLRSPRGIFTNELGLDSGGQDSPQGADTKKRRYVFHQKGTHIVEPSRGGCERILTVNRCLGEVQELDGGRLGRAADSLTDGKCACKLTRCCRVARGSQRPRELWWKSWEADPGVCPISENDVAVERVASSSENCGRVHDKTTSTNGVSGIVRGSSLSAWASGGERADALAPSASTNCTDN
jgi:hypothetical protein